MRLIRLCLAGALLVAAADRPFIVAHRGGLSLRPENTLPAFDNAVALGADMIEFDMVVTADDAVVINHDLTVSRRNCAPTGSAANGPVRGLTLAQVRQFDCGNGARIPTLEELVSRFRHSKVQFFAETKMDTDESPNFVQPRKFVQLVYAVVKKFGVSGRFILQSGDYRTITEMQKLDPRVRTCLLNARRYKPDYVGVARRYRATYLMLNANDVTAGGIAGLQQAGFQVVSSTADDPVSWRRYLALGVDGVLTNNPEALIRFLNAPH